MSQRISPAIPLSQRAAPSKGRRVKRFLFYATLLLALLSAPAHAQHYQFDVSVGVGQNPSQVYWATVCNNDPNVTSGIHYFQLSEFAVPLYGEYSSPEGWWAHYFGEGIAWVNAWNPIYPASA
jgi:hypothetical protein